MLKSYKYRLYPTEAQKERINQWIYTCRFIYNAALETKDYVYRVAGISLGAFELCKELKEIRKDYPWIDDVDSQALRFELLKLEQSYNNFFRGGGYPKHKNKSIKGSFSCSYNTRRVNWEKGLLDIPKIYNIPIKLNRKFDGIIKTVTISRTATNKYYASILVEDGLEVPKKKEIEKNTSIGVDTGIKTLAAISDGRSFENIKSLHNSLKRLEVLSRRASRKKKGSKNRAKANKKVALLHEYIRNKRTDHIHKITHALTHDSQVNTICVEDLDVAKMFKDRRISRAISDVGLGEFYRQLGYKTEWNGINLIKIDRYDPSSKRCNCCGSINGELILSDRHWICSKCESDNDRDLNAAKNILWYGLEKVKSGMDSPEGLVELSTLVGAMKQENIKCFT